MVEPYTQGLHDSQHQGFNFNIYENTDDSYSAEIVGTDSCAEDDEDWACDEIWASRDYYTEYFFSARNWKAAEKMITKEIKAYLKSGEYAQQLLQSECVGCGFTDGCINIVYQSGLR